MIGDYWTKSKLDRIEAHLPVFTREMDAKSFATLYVDAFAGDGVVELPKAKVFKNRGLGLLANLKIETCVPGSARRALAIDPPFDRYLLNDNDSFNCQKLREMRDEFPELAERVFVRNRDANDFVLDVCERYNWGMTRAVFLLDPYATQLRWSTLEAVAETKAADVWYLFPISAVVRLLARKGIDGEARRQTLRDVLGIDDIDGEFYRSWVHTGMVTKETSVRTARTTDLNRLVEHLVVRFRALFEFVPWPKWVTNRTNSTMFLLFFASAIGKRKTTEFVEKKLMRYPFNAPLPQSVRPSL
jgi:three-Cys-motif partner protein